MFQFPAFALPRLCVHLGVTLRWGFPIRTSPDQLLFARSPELFAGCRVLRRFSMPRHPPYTLKSLTTFTDHRQKKSRMQNIECRMAVSRHSAFYILTSAFLLDRACQTVRQ